MILAQGEGHREIEETTRADTMIAIVAAVGDMMTIAGGVKAETERADIADGQHQTRSHQSNGPLKARK